jgi:hypothetical protein
VLLWSTGLEESMNALQPQARATASSTALIMPRNEGYQGAAL